MWNITALYFYGEAFYLHAYIYFDNQNTPYFNVKDRMLKFMIVVI